MPRAVSIFGREFKPIKRGEADFMPAPPGQLAAAKSSTRGKANFLRGPLGEDKGGGRLTMGGQRAGG